MEISDEEPRVAVWMNSMIREAVRQDTRSDGSFGAAPVGFHNLHSCLKYFFGTSYYLSDSISFYFIVERS
jgi:hypothetical protein